MAEQNNLRLYDAFKAVPDDAKKVIGAGRLKGFTDISPMWRIKKLTEAFGPCGIGWKVLVTGTRILTNDKNGEIAAFVDIELYFRETPESDWSAPVYGTGGSKFITSEKSGLYTDDDAFKKAYTDAISVACKALGIAADVYWDKDADKYGYGERTERALELIEEAFTFGQENQINAIAVQSRGRFVKDLTDEELEALVKYLRERAKK